MLIFLTEESFKKDGLGWRLQQLQQRIGEWWELQLQKWNFKLPNPDLNPIANLSFLWEIIKGIFLILLVILILWLTWIIIKRWFPYFQLMLTQTHQSFQEIQDKLSQESSVDKLFARSQKFQQQGNYYQACRYLYLAMLQRLNDSGMIPHQASMTNDEYQLLTSQLPDPDPYETILIIHQQICFGNQNPTLSLFETCQQAYQKIDI
ncbi:DUF4129 domain-containing protein [Aphanothece sacrum]|uniref:Protein-glutamine gamma-glutamyltransferase-like C-terminal domain-containing protein n=1 Tax=Aphanothece sacrum FPU1 TaxID=1920663 RepID=A0A401IJN7_APHSA|nr:DUF4129 domain-containing protein [Aphanothece sacrum]GBF81512.1 hypothetical protein AsFPU1_2926 [Aphanothece sacrum FPU1]GBF86466.1 hypothetical protein AsFPU3_3537 [Aphanothece sacrum FPU3]